MFFVLVLNIIILLNYNFTNLVALDDPVGLDEPADHRDDEEGRLGVLDEVAPGDLVAQGGTGVLLLGACAAGVCGNPADLVVLTKTS